MVTLAPWLDNASPELRAAVAEAKRTLGIEPGGTASAGEIAPLLPDHMAKEFWEHAVERYLADELAKLPAKDGPE